MMTCRVHTTPANEHDSQGTGDLMDKVPDDERTEAMGTKVTSLKK